MSLTSPASSPEGKTPGRLAILKFFLLLYLPMALALCGLVYGFINISARLQLQDIKVQEAGEIKVAAQLLNHDFRLVTSDLLVLSKATSLQRYLDSGDEGEKERLTRLFQTMSGEKRIYDQIRYLDDRGMEVIRVDWKDGEARVISQAELQDKSQRYFFRDSIRLGAGEIFVSPLDLNVEHGKVELPYKPMLRFGTPVFDGAGRKKGVVLINYLGRELLQDFQRAMGEKKHAMLLNQEGHWLSSPDPAQEWGFMLGHDQRFGSRYPTEWKSISAQESGNLLSDKGLFSFTTVYPLLGGQYSSTGSPLPTGASERLLTPGQLQWKIVSLVPAEDMPAASLARFPRTTALLLFALPLLALLAYYLVSVLLSRRQLHRAVAENEARLRESNELLERIFSSAHFLLAYFDAEFNFIRVNRAYAEADHKEPDFFPGRRHFELYPSAENEAIFRRARDTGEPYVAYAKPFEYPERPEWGVTYWDWSLIPVKGRGGQVEGLLLSLSDVTARKRAEDERLSAEAKFHLVFDNAGDAILIHDVDGRFLEVNRVMCERLGYSHDELLRLSPRDINVPEQAARFEERGKALRAHGQIIFETVHVARDGRHIPVEVIARLIDFGGRPATLSVVRDITQRKQAEAALRQSEERGRALLNAAAETAMLMDREGTVLAINEVGARRLGKKAEQMIGHNFYAMLPPDLAASRAEKVNEVFRTGQPVHLRDKRDDYCFDSHVYPILDAAGQVSQVAVYAADITEKTQLQAVDTLLHEIDQQVLRSKSLALLLHFICTEMARLFGYRFAWIGRKMADGSVLTSAWAGAAAAYRDELERIGVRWDDTPQGQGPTGTTIRSGQTQVFRYGDPAFQPWRESAERFDLRAIIGIPLIIRGEVYGAFTLYAQHERSFDDPATLQRLNNIAGRICVALETALDQEQLRLLGTALSSAGNGIFITDRRGRIRWVNASFSRITGYGAEETLGETPSILKSGMQDEAYYQSMWHTILAGKVWSSETVERRKDGTLFTVQQTVTPIRNEEGEITHFISILEDITAQKETEARIQHMAHFDALTDLPNRALFYDRLSQVLTQSRRDKLPCALMFLDLDRFKAVNDTLGHHVGDLLLQGVARRLKECVRESDTVARLAGDEFTVLLPRVEGREDARVVAEKIVAALSRPFLLEGNEVPSSTSIGIALYPEDGDGEDALVKNADQAMYAAKQRGRGNYCFFDSGSGDSL